MNIEDMLSGKEKLEFGNEEQIEALNNYEEVQKECEEGLKLFKVILYHSGSSEVEVEAYDEQEAGEKAKEEISDFDIEWEDIEHIEVHLIKEKEKP